jgi:Mat/Ecp fimbriae major subunit
MKNFLKLSAISITLIGFSANALAANSNGDISANVVGIPLGISQTTALIIGNFSSGAASGTIDQSGAVTGGVIAASGGPTRSAGVFTVTGSGNSNYSFTLPATATISSGGNNMTTTLTFASSGTSGTVVRALSSGTENVTINGSLAVPANQALGAYTGTYNVTVTY